MPPAKMPNPETMLEPPAGAESTALGEPTPWYPGVSSSRSNCVSVGCRPMSTVSGRELKGVAHDVVTAGKVERAMRVDGVADGRSIVGDAVAFYAERVDVDPFRGGRKRRNRRRQRRGHRAERGSLVAHAHGAHAAFAGNDEAEVEVADLVDRAFAGNLFAACAQQREGGHVAQHGGFKADFSERIFLVADDDGLAGEIFEAAVLCPQLIGVFGIDVDGRRRVAEAVADEREADLVLADGGFALAVEDGVNERELPGGRGFFGEDAVAAAVEAQIFGLVADLVERGEARAHVEVHVAEIGVLRDVKADGDGGRIAGADLEVDVAHRRVERVGIGVGDGVIWRHGSGRRKGNTARRMAKSAEDDHDAHALLKSGRVVAENEDGARGAIAEDAHPGPDVERSRDAVTARGDEDDAFAVILRFVDGRLDGR